MASTYVPFKLHPVRDADILAAIEGVPDKSARLRELIRAGLTVTRNTVESPKSVLRNTESVTRNTPGQESSRQPLVDPRPAPVPPASNGAPPTFVPPDGFLAMTKPEQNRIRAQWFADHEAKKG